MEHVVSLGHAAIFVAKQGIGQCPNAALVDGGVAPVDVRFCVVDRDTQNLGATLPKLIQAMVESDKLGRSDKGEIFGVEEQHDILALVIRQGDLFGRAVFHDRGSREIGRGFVNENRHGFALGCYRRIAEKVTILSGLAKISNLSLFERRWLGTTAKRRLQNRHRRFFGRQSRRQNFFVAGLAAGKSSPPIRK